MIEEIIELMEKILHDTAIPLEEEGKNSDINAKSCNLGINFEYCNRWKIDVGCLKCKEYKGEIP